MKPSLTMINVVLAITFVCICAMFVAAAHAEEPTQWVYVTLKVEAPRTLPTQVAAIITAPATEYEWANDTTIAGFFTSNQLDELHGYVAVVNVSPHAPIYHTFIPSISR